MAEVTKTRVNVTLGGGKAVHTGHRMAVEGREYAATPECGGNRASERYRETTAEVTCKKCLKLLAAEAEAEAAYQDRLAASMAPSADFHATPEAADQAPEIREIRETAEAKADELRTEAASLRAGRPLPKLVPGTPRPAFTRESIEERAGQLFDELAGTLARVVEDTEVIPDEQPGPIVAELNGRPAVWMVLHQGHQMWQCRDAQGLYTSKDRAVRAQRAATAVRRAVNLKW
ncbi:hypothetical protein SEA_XKCD426_74 [Streptomyces phage Xkcd426]|nr:hypothetical protein SEA_XKCD426_74 [Streptomyces phage Xkcd426]